MRGRSERRAAKALAKGRARARARRNGIESAKWVARSAVMPHPCSGWCCGNPRRWWGEATLAERRAPSAADWD